MVSLDFVWIGFFGSESRVILTLLRSGLLLMASYTFSDVTTLIKIEIRMVEKMALVSIFFFVDGDDGVKKPLVERAEGGREELRRR